MGEAKSGRPAKIYDLFTGSFIKFELLKNMEAGEYIFYRCLEEVLEMSPEEVSKVFVSVVKEPGKARSVTKGMISLKIVLDVINKIVSYPLSKVETSKSGMGMDAHGWNLFTEMFKHPGEVFHKLKIEHSGTSSQCVRKVTYDDVFAECTDFTNATDAMNHTVSRIIANKWMNKCGIPRVLQRIAFKTCFSKRKVFFNGRGVFSQLGEDDGSGTNTRFVTLQNGILMGDPLTKVLLHFTNISIRCLGRYLATGRYGSIVGDQPIHSLTCDVDTGLLPVVRADAVLVEDMRLLDAGLGNRNTFPIPARVMPVPVTGPNISIPLARIIAKISDPGRRIDFLLPGVFVLFEGLDENGAYEQLPGFIPKAFRDPAMLENQYYMIFPGIPCKIIGIRNPEDMTLKLEGYIPVNPYRKKKILSERDMEEMTNDHLLYFRSGEVPSNITSVRRVMRTPKTNPNQWNIFRWLGLE